MIYFENASYGEEGFNTHVLSWTMCIALSNFLDRDFYFDFEIPSSTPPAYAFEPDFKEKFGLLLNSPRSLVSQLVDIPNRRVLEVDRNTSNKRAYQLLYSYFATTEEMKRRFEGSIIWDSFSVGRLPLVREELADVELIEWTHTKLSAPAVFFFLPREEKRTLLRSVKIAYLDSIERLARRITNDLGEFYAAHIRLGDYFENYEVDGYMIAPDRFRRYVGQIFDDREIPILLATDGLHEKNRFAEIFDDRKLLFVDELIFDNYFGEYLDLEFTDFNVLSVLNQLLCASALSFVGTYRSTFTSIIHRLRQERMAAGDHHFFPDEKVARLLDQNGVIAADRPGFFDWNRYSVFAESHSAMSWMREWNHELSAVDL